MKLGNSLKSIDPYADYFHVDIMDGTITPLISFGTWIIPLLRETVETPLEIHLYTRKPIELLDEVLEMGISRVLLDQETISNLNTEIRAYNKEKLGLYIFPTDSVDMIDISLLEHVSLVNIVTVKSLQGGQKISWNLVEKTNWFDKIRSTQGFHFDISIDGGLNESVLPKVLEYPVDQLIIGSAIFSSENPSKTAKNLRELFTLSKV
jgi:ribulose-phosphate 3-epimerase